MATKIQPKRSNPVGYRFHPTDQELVGHFLNRKILNPDDEKMPIAELKVCDFEPWELSDKSKIKSNDQVYYFFCPRDYKYTHSRRSNRTTKAGYWKPTGKPRKVKDIRTKKPIGTKRTLVFYEKEHPKAKAVRTKWIMHEYEYIPQGNFLLCKLKAKSKGHISNSEPKQLASASESAMAVNSSCDECAPSDNMGSNVEDHNLDEMTPVSAYDKGEQTSDILVSEQDEWSPHTATPDCGNHNAHDNTDMSTLSVASGLEIDAAEATFLEGLPTFFDAMKALLEPKDGLNSALFSPGRAEEITPALVPFCLVEQVLK
ncbi:NAC domain-containing protein 71 isoform X2 [Hevea brasiliensis]|uniref:NAC domain-containing protein 71 isoform X2 n=1 Tax=Hevea brasiliensis TaxID=3981 RepID=UPI000B784306|nr:NAC domain-containing protein 71 isoform X2 [Hevea brasiliensis]